MIKYFNQNDNKVYTLGELKALFYKQMDENPNFNFFTFEEFLEAGLNYGEKGCGLIDVTEKCDKLLNSLQNLEKAFYDVYENLEHKNSGMLSENCPFGYSFEEMCCEVSYWVESCKKKYQ